MRERPIQVFKGLDVFELPLPPKPHVCSGNFPLVCAFLSCCWAAASSGFTKGLEEKHPRQSKSWDIFLSQEITFSFFSPTTSKAHEESHEKKAVFSQKSLSRFQAEEPGGSQELGKQGWISEQRLDPAKPFEGLPTLNCSSLAHQHSECFPSLLCIRIKRAGKSCSATAVSFRHHRSAPPEGTSDLTLHTKPQEEPTAARIIQDIIYLKFTFPPIKYNLQESISCSPQQGGTTDTEQQGKEEKSRNLEKNPLWLCFPSPVPIIPSIPILKTQFCCPGDTLNDTEGAANADSCWWKPIPPPGFSPPLSSSLRAISSPCTATSHHHAEKHRAEMSKQKTTSKLMAGIYLNKSSFFTSNVIHTTLI